MSDVSVDVVVNNILNGMTKELDEKQLQKLKNQLYIQLHDYEITNKCYDIVEVMKENDAKAVQVFVASQRVRRLSEKSIKQYLHSLWQMRNFVGKNFADIQTVDIKFYLATYSQEHNWKTTTLCNNIHNLNQFFKFMRKEGLIETNPMDKVEPVRQEKVIKETFSTSELEQIRIACKGNDRDLAMVEFLLATAVRVGDLVKLTWGDLDFNHLEFIVRKGKGNKDRIVPFTEKAGFYLLKYLEYRMKKENRTRDEMMLRPVFCRVKKDPITKDYEALTNGGVEDILKRVALKAGIHTKNNPHKYRRTMATEAINKGMKIEVLMNIMGHEQYDTTLGYAKIRSTMVDHSYRMICD